ncbi:ATP-binding protein [Actinocorallia sp. B10E7]|uniref:AlbA family DNA-binding domain-containing protein n=1 Tax=Actinocorallia sp. B10E7 TaxID=3153558 RepID=UPI00325D48C5
MTSPQSLLYCSPSDVTIERVRALVDQVGPEAPTVEYKEGFSQTLAKAVAALANTYGGLVLVGVTDARAVSGVEEKTIESIAEHCHAKLEPPWIPEILPVPLDDGSGLYVLVMRVVPGRAPRPLLVDGRAPIRYQNTTQSADWQRLKGLFTERAASEESRQWNVMAPAVTRGANGSDIDFIIRSGLNVAVADEAKWQPLSERTVSTLTDALNGSPLDKALRDLCLQRAETASVTPFHRRGINRAHTVNLEWQGYPDGWMPGDPKPIEARASLEVPGAYGSAGTNLQFTLDVTVRLSSWIQATGGRQAAPGRADGPAPRWRIALPMLAELMEALATTFTNPEVVAPISDLARVDPVAVPQPRVLHLVTERPILEVLDATGLKQIPDAGVSRGGHLLADPALDLADPADRRRQIQGWLSQLALDAGLLGMEQLLAEQDPL